MTEEQQIKLGEYLEGKVKVKNWYKKGNLRVLEVDETISRKTLNGISEIMATEDIEISMIHGRDGEDILAVAWVEK